MEFDEDTAPVVARLDAALERLQAAASRAFDPAKVNEETIPELLSVEDQANFANVSAFALATSMYGLRRLAGQPTNPQLLEKISRVKAYAAKVREAGAVANSEETGKRRRRRDDVVTAADGLVEATKPREEPEDDAEAADTKPPPAKAARPQLDKEALKRVMNATRSAK